MFKKLILYLLCTILGGLGLAMMFGQSRAAPAGVYFSLNTDLQVNNSVFLPDLGPGGTETVGLVRVFTSTGASLGLPSNYSCSGSPWNCWVFLFTPGIRNIQILTNDYVDGQSYIAFVSQGDGWSTDYLDPTIQMSQYCDGPAGVSCSTFSQLSASPYIYYTKFTYFLTGSVPIPPDPPVVDYTIPPQPHCAQYWRVESTMADNIDRCNNRTDTQGGPRTGQDIVAEIYGWRSLDPSTITGTLEQLTSRYNNYHCAAAVALARAAEDVYSSDVYDLIITRAWNRAMGSEVDFYGEFSNDLGIVRCRDNGDNIGDVVLGSGRADDFLSYLPGPLQPQFGSLFNGQTFSQCFAHINPFENRFNYGSISQSLMGLANCTITLTLPNFDAENTIFDTSEFGAHSCPADSPTSSVGLLIGRLLVLSITAPYTIYLFTQPK